MPALCPGWLCAPVGTGLVVIDQVWLALPMQMVTRPPVSECSRHKAAPCRCSPFQLWEAAGWTRETMSAPGLDLCVHSSVYAHMCMLGELRVTNGDEWLLNLNSIGIKSQQIPYFHLCLHSSAYTKVYGLHTFLVIWSKNVSPFLNCLSVTNIIIKSALLLGFHSRKGGSPCNITCPFRKLTF